jgi:hypothetical protein
MQQSKLL